MMQSQQTCIETAFEQIQNITPKTINEEVKQAVQDVLHALDQGRLRVAEKRDGTWIVHEWIKKAVLLSFRLFNNICIDGNFTQYYDKVHILKKQILLNKALALSHQRSPDTALI